MGRRGLSQTPPPLWLTASVIGRPLWSGGCGTPEVNRRCVGGAWRALEEAGAALWSPRRRRQVGFLKRRPGNEKERETVSDDGGLHSSLCNI